MELEQTGDGQVHGRGFVKQDHQGPDPGSAHPGVVAAALTEAIAFVAAAEIESFEIRLVAPVPVGAFIEVEARAERDPDGRPEVTAWAWVEQQEVASARGAYRG
jgi:acyl-coenzyme A thioesterase PaaI-like protein